MPGYYRHLLHRIAMRELRHYVKELRQYVNELENNKPQRTPSQDT